MCLWNSPKQINVRDILKAPVFRSTAGSAFYACCLWRQTICRASYIMGGTESTNVQSSRLQGILINYSEFSQAQTVHHPLLGLSALFCVPWMLTAYDSYALSLYITHICARACAHLSPGPCMFTYALSFHVPPPLQVMKTGSSLHIIMYRLHISSW